MAPGTPPDAGDGTTSSGSNSPDKRKIDQTKRSRWATRKMTIKSSNVKRLSLMGRHTLKHSGSEKQRHSGGEATLDSLQENEADEANGAAADNEDEPAHEPRQLYFNLPLPENLLDEDGNPAQQYTRNKIRTAKYTPLSFLPKNLWFQFQNIANIFFLFLVILVVSVPIQNCYLSNQMAYTNRSSLYSAVPTPGSTPCP